jgi:hypothetical protein
MISKWTQLLLKALLVIVTSYAISGFASSETNTTPIGGEVATRINGFTITNLEFSLADDPFYLDSVVFDLDHPASFVAIQVDQFGSSFQCQSKDSYNWICEVENVRLRDLDQLSVTAIG